MLLNDGAAARQCHSSGGGARHRDGGAGMHRGQLRVKRLARRRAAGVNQVRRHSAQAVAFRAGRYVVCVAAAFEGEKCVQLQALASLLF